MIPLTDPNPYPCTDCAAAVFDSGKIHCRVDGDPAQCRKMEAADAACSGPKDEEDAALCSVTGGECDYEGDPDKCPDRQQRMVDAMEDRAHDAAVDERAERQEAS